MQLIYANADSAKQTFCSRCAVSEIRHYQAIFDNSISIKVLEPNTGQSSVMWILQAHHLNGFIRVYDYLLTTTKSQH